MSTREKILDNAERLFTAKGFDGVSVRDITKAAGTNVASVNYHFASKRELYREVFRRKLKRLSETKIADMDRALSTQQPTLHNTIQTVVSVLLSDTQQGLEAEDFLNIITAEMSEGGMATDILVEEGAIPMHRKVRELISGAMPDISQEHAALCTTSIFGQIFHFVRARALLTHTLGRPYDRKFIEDVIEHITTFSVGGIMGAMKTESSRI
jgi:AcrR family transcriptional regulator